MWIQILIIGFSLWLLWFAAHQKPTAISALKKLGIILLGAAMAMSVLFPDAVNSLAHSLGIGRGADLLLYGLAATFILYALTQYTRAQANRRLIFALARHVALIEANSRRLSRAVDELREDPPSSPMPSDDPSGK